MNIDAHLLSEVALLAARSNRTLEAIVDHALRRFLKSIKPHDSAEFVLPSHGQGGLRPGVDLGDRDAIVGLLGD